jgi:TolB protein
LVFRESSGSGGPKIEMTDIFGHGEFLAPTPNYASAPSWGSLMR